MIDELSLSTGLKKKETTLFLESFVDIIRSSVLEKKLNVRVANLGIFKYTAGGVTRKGNNIRTGEIMTSVTKDRISFKFAQSSKKVEIADQE